VIRQRVLQWFESQKVGGLQWALMSSAIKALRLAHAPLGRQRFARALSRAGDRANVSIGAGRARLPGWINTDIDRGAEAYLDLTKRWPLQGSGVWRIYGDNVIEHFDLAAGRIVLHNCYEALAPGGRIRLVTPDVECTARGYLVGGPEFAAPHLKLLRSYGKVAEYPVDLLRVTFAEWGHWSGYCYDFSALRTELERAGFVNVVRAESEQSGDSVFRNLESRAGSIETELQLVVEADRPLR